MSQHSGVSGSLFAMISSYFWQMKGCYSGDTQTGPGQVALGTEVCVFVYPNRESLYLLWTGLGPGQHTAFP